ncbi:MAG: nitroreductase family protein, partial [Bdellovibrionaceae bacterium]|nr:nitroreductase family protein [Pseudobdellovibrionaceae bacterium]MDW8191218.1 nitroreductase family protein [Pseudobdellovibrionaceae bacterium]
QGPRSSEITFWAQKQVYIALGFVLLAAASLRIDACPMEGIQVDRYNEILGLNQSPYSSLVAVALGYRDSRDPLASQPKVRFTTDEMWKVIS